MDIHCAKPQADRLLIRVWGSRSAQGRKWLIPTKFDQSLIGGAQKCPHAEGANGRFPRRKERANPRVTEFPSAPLGLRRAPQPAGASCGLDTPPAASDTDQQRLSLSLYASNNNNII